MADFSAAELRRYSRHLLMPEIGLAGQQNLKDASVLCVGAGGLGSPVALYLAAAGVGRLGLVEDDLVDLSNIQRQVLYATADVGRPKLEAAAERLRGLNPEIEVVTHPMRLEAGNAADVIDGYDVVVDGSDNFPTRYLVNDTAVLGAVPVVHASVFRFEGQLTVFDATRGPCYRCVFPEPPPTELVPSCAEGGVLGVLPGILGSLQALEALKLLLGVGSPLVGRLLLFDGLDSAWRELPLQKDPGCALCGASPTIHDPVDASPAGHTGDKAATELPKISVEELAHLRSLGQAPELIDVREAHELEIAVLPGARLIPLAQLPLRLDELDPACAYVLSCHRGGRSARAWQLMRAAGFQHLQVLEGGIDAWAARIDTSLARY